MHTPPSPYEDGEVTIEKAKWVEEQVARNFDFHVESFELLTKAAETTLGWLFGILIGASSYAASHFLTEPIWVSFPLIGATLSASFAAGHLLLCAMRVRDVPTPGNTSENILGENDERLKINEAWLRLSEAKGVGEQLKKIIQINEKKGKAVNLARLAVIEIPALTLVLIVALACLL